MKLMPLHDWAVIVPSEGGARTAGGIYIPDTAKEKPAEGMVESIGPGALEEEKPGRRKEAKKKERRFIPTTVKPGNYVLYERYAGQKVAIGDEERVLVRERNILGLLPERPAPVKEDLPPLQIPAVTSFQEKTALAKRSTTAVTSPLPLKKETKEAQKKTDASKPKKSPVKKSSSKKPKKR